MSDLSPLDSQLNDMWQKVPEEERRDLLLRAQASAMEACALTAVVGCAAAFSLHAPVLVLCVALLLPVLFRVISIKLCVRMKPQTLLQYVVAAIASKRYAAATISKDTSLKLIFRGSLESVPLDDSAPETAPEVSEEDARSNSTTVRDVWISLFPDSLIMISEGDNGAHLEFAHSTLEDFVVALDSSENTESDSAMRRLLIQTGNEEQITGRWVLSSPYPSMLVECERKIQFLARKSAEASPQHAQLEPSS
jgi:hypothetical protein